MPNPELLLKMPEFLQKLARTLSLDLDVLHDLTG
jgi:hypothetical protein